LTMQPVRSPPPPRDPSPGPIPPPPPIPYFGPTELQFAVFIFALAVGIATACYVAFNDYQRTHAEGSERAP